MIIFVVMVTCDLMHSHRVATKSGNLFSIRENQGERESFQEVKENQGAFRFLIISVEGGDVLHNQSRNPVECDGYQIFPLCISFCSVQSVLGVIPFCHERTNLNRQNRLKAL